MKIVKEATEDPQMNFRIRELEDQDWGAVAGLIRQYLPGGVTGDILRRRSSIWKPTDPIFRNVHVDASGNIVGYFRCSRKASDPDGFFRFENYVDLSAAGRGLGRKQLEFCESFAIERNAKFLLVSVEESCGRGCRLAERAGYEVVQHLFESHLDLATFDPGPHLGRQIALEDEGFRFTNMASEGDTDENWRKLHELDSITDQDTPGSENWSLGSWEDYRQIFETQFQFSPAAIQVALWQGRWVGINIVGPTPIDGRMETSYTGVLKEFRGKGLAQALKVIGIQYAKSLGGRLLVTNNDERNCPMLAVNAKLGFEVKPGFFMFRKAVTPV